MYFCYIEKYNFRVSIKYYFLRENLLKETEAKLWGRTITCFSEFRCGRTTPHDAEHLGRPNEVKNKVLFHHDNAPAHLSAIAMTKLPKLRYETKHEEMAWTKKIHIEKFRSSLTRTPVS